MGKINEFFIHFDHPEAVFFAGCTVRGHVMLDLKVPMQMRGIYLKLIGYSQVSWKSRVAFEEIMKETRVLVEDKKGPPLNMFTHPAGTQMYTFTFQLPSDIPSSFLNKFGHIKYMLKAKIERPWKSDKKVGAFI